MGHLLRLFLLLTAIHGLTCERLHKQIYSTIEGGAACFRRLNGTHQAGCSSSNGGAVGVVQMVNEINDANWIVQNSTAGPYIAVVNTVLFYDVISILMDQPDNIAGILLYDNATESTSAFSQESRCPNEYSSDPLSQCKSSQAGGIVWNTKGTGLMREDIPYPIFYLPKSQISEVTKIQQCYERYNLDKENQKGNPLCSVQLNSFMYAAVSTEICLRRSASSALLSLTKVCDPLGDYNVYHSLLPRIQSSGVKQKPVTLVTARIDTASLFDGVAPGAASSVVGMVTLLMTAATLSQMIPRGDTASYERNILFTLFNGEAFDYIGSQRVAYDMSRGAWPPGAPLSPNDVSLHIELGQLGGSLNLYSSNASWPLYAFVPKDIVTTAPQITEFLNLMLSNLNLSNMTLSSEFTSNLPPSSLHSFRRILTNVTSTGDFAEVLLVDHKETFTNMFYESVLDDDQNVGFNYHNISVDFNGKFIPTDELLANGTMTVNEIQVKMSRVATALARTLYQQVVGKAYVGDVAASAHLADETLFCFLQSQACRLLSAAEFGNSGDDAPAPTRPAPLYVGVAAWSGTAAVFAGHLLALLTGTHLPLNKTACDALLEPGFSHIYLKGWNNTGVCVQTTMNFSQAVSPAFVISDYDLKSGEYSSWTESVWQTMSARVFVRAGGGGAIAAAITGVLATAVAAALTYWLRKHAALIFPEQHSLQDATGILRTVNC